MNDRGTFVLAAVAAWVASISFDLFLHAGLLAFLYVRKDPFLLSAESAFARIPLGYAAFLILAIALVWLIRLARIKGKWRGFLFGLEFGFLIWAAFLIGLYSISIARTDLLLGWWLGQSLELGISGFVIGAVLEGAGLKKTLLWVILFLFLMVVATIVLQISGLAPPMKTV